MPIFGRGFFIEVIKLAKGDFQLKVDGVLMPCPSGFSWGLQDISAAESGRTEDTTMHKNRVGQKRKISLQWNAIDFATSSTILRAFNPEYVEVYYPDPLAGRYETRTFYVGDRTAPFKYYWVGNQRLEHLSFDIIEQ